MRILGGAFLERGVDEDPIGIAVPRGHEPGLLVGVLQDLDLTPVEYPAVARIVAQHAAVAILLGGPQEVPALPEALVTQVGREQAVKVRQAFFGQQVERQGDARAVGNAPGALAKRCRAAIRVLVLELVGGQEVAREPQLALLEVTLHEASDQAFEIAQDLDPRRDLAVGVVGAFDQDIHDQGLFRP